LAEHRPVGGTLRHAPVNSKITFACPYAQSEVSCLDVNGRPRFWGFRRRYVELVINGIESAVRGGRVGSERCPCAASGRGSWLRAAAPLHRHGLSAPGKHVGEFAVSRSSVRSPRVSSWRAFSAGTREPLSSTRGARLVEPNGLVEEACLKDHRPRASSEASRSRLPMIRPRASRNARGCCSLAAQCVGVRTVGDNAVQ
jgi:hypothetical protein